MRVGFCQMDVIKRNIEANLKKIACMLEPVDAKLIVLPELCLTGYVFLDKGELMGISCEVQTRYAIDFLTSLCRRKGFHLVVGISEADNNRLYNTAIIVGPEGLVGKHRKVHLSKNETIFHRGDSLDVFDIEGVKIGVTICFDIWVPEASRVLALKGAQIICCPCNFGGPWTLDIARVRAMENKVCSIVSNRIGQEEMGEDMAHFRGESMVVDYMGDVLISAGSEECVKTVEINPEEVIKKDTIMSDDLLQEAGINKMIRYQI